MGELCPITVYHVYDLLDFCFLDYVNGIRYRSHNSNLLEAHYMGFHINMGFFNTVESTIMTDPYTKISIGLVSLNLPSNLFCLYYVSH